MILSLVGVEPDRVSAVGSFFLQSQVADVTTTHMSFPGGENAHVFVSWLHPYKEQKLVVVGDDGMAVFDDTVEWEQKLQIYRHRILWENSLPTTGQGRSRGDCRGAGGAVTAGTGPFPGLHCREDTLPHRRQRGDPRVESVTGFGTGHTETTYAPGGGNHESGGTANG